MDEKMLVQAREKAYAYLSHKPRTTMEVRKKLDAEGYEPHIVEQIINLLNHYRYIDDRQYAADYIESRRNAKGYGSLRIRDELLRRGIEVSTVEALLSQNETDEVEQALLFLEKKTKNQKELSQKDKIRCIGYLQRRGFSLDVIQEAFKTYFGGCFDVWD